MPNDKDEKIPSSNEEGIPTQVDDNESTSPEYTEYTALFKTKPPKQHEQLAIKFIKSTKSFLDGLAKSYSTFGVVAIVYNKSGLWLIGPVFAGGAICLSHELVKKLNEHYPDNSALKTISQCTKFGDLIVLDFCKDFGFCWNFINSLCSIFDAPKSTFSLVSKYLGPMLSGGLALIIRFTELSKDDKDNPHFCLNIISETSRAMFSSTYSTGIAYSLGWITNSSPIPLAFIGLSTILGFCSGVVHDSHPKLASAINTLITMLFDNPSLAAVLLSIPDDIASAVNPEHDLSDSYFFSFAGISGFYLVLLTIISLYESLTSPEHNERVEDIEDHFASTDDELIISVHDNDQVTQRHNSTIEIDIESNISDDETSESNDDITPKESINN